MTKFLNAKRWAKSLLKWLRRCNCSEIMVRDFIRTVHKTPKKLRNVFIYKKPDTFQKARQFPLRFYIQKAIRLTLRDFHEIFEVGIYTQKAWNFALRDVFIYKKLDTSQKPRKIAIRPCIQKSGTLRYAIFHWIFEICGGGRTFIYWKNNSLFMTFLYWKIKHFFVTLLYTKSLTLCVTF